MISEVMKELEIATTSTFEQLGFLMPDEEVSEDQAAAEITASSRVRFRGPVSGVLEIEVAGGFLEELASNMLGSFEELEEEVIMDALGEVSNVICGNVLPSLSGRNAVYDLSAPETSTEPLTPGVAGCNGNPAKVVIGVNEGRAEITLRIIG